jgi:hypothetical protein
MKFQTEKFKYDGMYLTYEGQFIARFKRGGKVEFVKFLVKNFSVEEYFAARSTLQPIQVLETKGFVSAKIKSCLKKLGYAPTQAGMKAYLDKKVA